MNIIASTTSDKKEIFRITRAMNTGKMADLEGQTIHPDAWVLYEDADRESGEVREVLAMVIDGNVYGTISQSFINQFRDMVDVFAEDFDFTVASATSKAGRKFIFPVIA